MVSFEHLSKAGKNLNAAVDNFNKFGNSINARVRPQALNLKRYTSALVDIEYPAAVDGVVAPIVLPEVSEGDEYLDLDQEE